MRKALISILVCLLLICSVFFVVKGAEKINTKGFMGLKEENEEVDKKIEALSNVINVNYENAASNLKRTAITLTNSKVEYENQALLSSSNSSSYASKLEKYEIDFLWTKLGNYAKEENVIIKIEVTSNETSSNLYNLNFSVTGGYVNITDFIYDIENDSRLGFKIDDFKMQMSEDKLLATFSCKEISLNVGQIDKPMVEENESNKKQSNTVNKNNTTNNNASTNSSSNKVN